MQDLPPLPPELERRVAAIWNAALAERPALFNGAVFSAERITASLITGRWSEYRRLVAQLREPELFDALGVRAVAVSGLLHGPSGVLLGQRDDTAIYHAGLWQLPPAGSLDRGAARPDGAVDLRAQLLAEAEEELGLPAQLIGDTTPICAVEHLGSHVLDIGLAAEMTLDLPHLLARHSASRDAAEYRRLVLVPVNQLAAHVDALAGQLVPSVPIFVHQWLARAGC